MSEPTVVVENLGKCYRIYPDSRARIKEALFFGKKKFHTERWALRDINFELFPGQALGIIGFNGAGKSTLLKILTGTSRQTTGTYRTRGTLSSLLELGAGFHSEFSGKENIYMNAAIQGIPKSVVRERYDEIAAFSELGEFLQRPVRTYSSGMTMRLAFAAATLANPDILILDEVLAVGDAHFQKKCMDRFNEFRKGNKTILFVSHSTYHIREICDRCIWIHDGQPVMDGDPIEVTDEYETRVLALQSPRAEHVDNPEAARTTVDRALAHFEDYQLYRNDQQEPTREFVTRDTLRIEMRFKNPDQKKGVLPGVLIHRNDGLMVFTSRPEAPVPPSREPIDITMEIPDFRLLAGEFTASLFLTDETGVHVIDQRVSAFRFKVSHQGYDKGVFLHDTVWRTRTTSDVRK